MNQENKSFFLMQAEKIVREVFDQVAEGLFERIDVKEYENQLVSEQSGENLQASAFYSIIAKDLLVKELEDEKESAFISNALPDSDSVNFLVIYYDSKKERLVQKYHDFCDCLKDALFDFLFEEWKKENFYFYNSSLSDIIIHGAINDLVTSVSKQCCGYAEIALYENINLSMLNILTELSYLTYEKSNAEGLIYFTNDVQNVDFQFKFDNYEDVDYFSIANLKLIRKLLELTSIKKGFGIISDTNRIYGVGKIKEGCMNYSVSFDEDHKWVLYKDDDELLSMKDNTLMFANARLNSSDFKSYVSEIFPEIDVENSENASEMLGIIKSLIKQQKGTILVVMKDAKKYIDRYRDLALLIEPVKLDEKNVEKLSSIDGAIIMDENCVCYGFGVVLDGKATGFGNRARGSRYNSSERFYNYCRNEDGAELFVFILSDDGNYNFFPDIRG